jgi:S-sulfo-L-cysteine synthase (O-acetyl-L-serine-dependent)
MLNLAYRCLRGSAELRSFDWTNLVHGLEGVTLLAKAEWLQPRRQREGSRRGGHGSQKAREEGNLGPGKILLDATSGNTGIALAMLGAAHGFPVRLAMPSNVSPERKHILKAYGAQVDWTDPDKGSDGAIRRARIGGERA